VLRSKIRLMEATIENPNGAAVPGGK